MLEDPKDLGKSQGLEVSRGCWRTQWVLETSGNWRTLEGVGLLWGLMEDQGAVGGSGGTHQCLVDTA